MIEWIPLNRIQDNPYQTRQVYDQPTIVELADDIWTLRRTRAETKGLIQVPLGRLVIDGRTLDPASGLFAYGTIGECLRVEPHAFVQIAAGHNRKRAFQHLADQHGDGYAHLPVDVTVLDDRAMSDIAWSENAKRKNLSAIEEALAIRRAMDDFGYTLGEIAKRWGISKSAASNKLRLLQLPDQVQRMVQAGELPERHARELLPLVQVGKSERAAVRVARKIERDDLPAARVTGVVANELERLTRQIAPHMLKWGDWDRGLGECPQVCAGCEHETRGRCARPDLYDRKVEIWRQRLVDLARSKTGLHGTVEGYGTLGAGALARAKKKGCKNLRVAFRHHVFNAVQVDEAIPHVYYACSKHFGCECEEAQVEIEEQERLAENPKLVALREWRDEQATRASEICDELLADLTERFRLLLERMDEDERPLFMALVKAQIHGVETSYEIEDLAKALALCAAPGTKWAANHGRIGKAMAYRAQVYGLARLATPIDEVEAHLVYLEDELARAEMAEDRLSSFQIDTTMDRVRMILKAHPGHEDLKLAFSELEAAIEAFSRENEETDES